MKEYGAEEIKRMPKKERDAILSAYIEELYGFPMGFLNIDSDLFDVFEFDDSDGILRMPWRKDVKFHKKLNTDGVKETECNPIVPEEQISEVVNNYLDDIETPTDATL